MDSYINKTVQAPQNHPPFSPASHPTNPPLRQPILQYPSKPHPFTLFLRPTTTQHATNPSHLARLQSSASAHNTPAIQPQYKQHTPCPSSIIPHSTYTPLLSHPSFLLPLIRLPHEESKCTSVAFYSSFPSSSIYLPYLARPIHTTPITYGTPCMYMWKVGWMA